jgi:hypothetical protein
MMRAAPPPEQDLVAFTASLSTGGVDVERELARLERSTRLGAQALREKLARRRGCGTD